MSSSESENQPVTKAPVKAKPPVKAKVPSKAAPAKAPVAPASVAKPAVKRKAVTSKVSAKAAPKPAKPAKPAVVKKPKLVRDSFTMPQVDHELIKQCKRTAVASGRETKKSEVVRAAIQTFAALSAVAQLAAYTKLQTIALGRPKSK